jgi:hypothetical protein
LIRQPGRNSRAHCGTETGARFGATPGTSLPAHTTRTRPSGPARGTPIAQRPRRGRHGRAVQGPVSRASTLRSTVPKTRLDPCSTCSRCFPCGDAARDLRSGSGLKRGGSHPAASSARDEAGCHHVLPTEVSRAWWRPVSLTEVSGSGRPSRLARRNEQGAVATSSRSPGVGVGWVGPSSRAHRSG